MQFMPCGCGTNKRIVSTTSSTLVLTEPKRLPPRPLWLNDWPTTGINRPHGALFLPAHVTRGSTHGLDDLCRVCVEEVLCCSHFAQHLPHCSLGEPERREWATERRRGGWSLFLAVPGVSQCTHIDFFCDGLEGLYGRVEVFLRAKSSRCPRLNWDGWPTWGKKESQNEEIRRDGSQDRASYSPVVGWWLFLCRPGSASGPWPHFQALFECHCLSKNKQMVG